MKKKVLAWLSVLVLSLVGISWMPLETFAQEATEEQDFSFLLTDDAIIGNMEKQPRGVYLLNGMSAINNAGGGKIAAGGSTTAARSCNVSVNVVVERLSGGSWVRVTSWTASKASALSVTTSKNISVGSGYYYRVRCTHSASSDVSTSASSSLWM